MIITFSNMKGGVGKSTLCVSFSNYLASQGLPVRVYDVDRQTTLVLARKADLEQEPERIPLFEITEVKFEKFWLEVKNLVGQPGFTLIDMPGMYSKEVIEILKHTDLVIIPFQYENYSITATGQFGSLLDTIIARNPGISLDSIYVPNRVNCTIGRKKDKEEWQLWEAAIRKVATLAPMIPDRVCMQRRSTLYLNPVERECVTPCFEFIMDRIAKMKDKVNQEDKV